jgi:arylsulfatase I/J
MDSKGRIRSSSSGGGGSGSWGGCSVIAGIVGVVGFVFCIGTYYRHDRTMVGIESVDGVGGDGVADKQLRGVDKFQVGKGGEHVLPNFVLIVADDMGWNSLGYTAQESGEEIGFATPILSNMATRGLIMDKFYAQEVCSPARASLLTGRYPLTLGMQYGMVAANAYWGLNLTEKLLPEVLRENSYATHALGKWHLGYYAPEYLPTARGFDSFIGYVNGENYYWSKHNTDFPDHIDMMESDTKCYAPYNRSDISTYSTYLYRDRAVEIIEQHDVDVPLFLYVAFQAVHDPFSDLDDDSEFADYATGIPSEYFSTSVNSQITNKITGARRQQYVSALALMDTAIGDINNALEAKNISDNTYVIFLSDNGGCHEGGGRNGPLRGSKGSLFEGGTRVISFIYGPSLLHTSGKYEGLMHISDWFPTILSLAGIDYDDLELDGYNHQSTWFSPEGGINSDPPRSTMLYNMYTALTDYDFNIWTNGSFAVRDNRFVLEQ